MAALFDRCVCVSLRRRPERWDAFLAGLPADWCNCLPPVERFDAVDGQVNTPPDWWRGHGRTIRDSSWGCYLSHRAIYEQIVSDGRVTLILEDDAKMVPVFPLLAATFMAYVPGDWGMVYLGGQLLRTSHRCPASVVPGMVYRAWNVNRTHAYAVHPRHAAAILSHVVDRSKWKSPFHIDHHLGRLHAMGEVPVYCPAEWLVHQRRDVASDITTRTDEPETWPSAKEVCQ